jgi:threonine/homoserine/homoserine lactone efflux protein
MGIIYAFAAAVQPGPLQAYLIAQTLSNGWRRTIYSSFAPLFSDAPIIVLMLFVLNNVPIIMIHILQCAGGIFILYLAFNAFKTWKNYDAKKVMEVQSSSQTFWKAVLVNLLNPNPYIGWSLVMGPILLGAWRSSPLNGIILLLTFYSTLIICTAIIIILFAYAKSIGPKISKMMVGISAVALAGFGIYQLYLGAFRLLFK